MDNNKRETINKSIYCLTMMNPILKKEKGNKKFHDQYVYTNRCLLKSFGIFDSKYRIDYSNLDLNIVEAENYLDLLYKDCRKYKQGRINKSDIASNEILNEFSSNTPFSNDMGLVIATISIQLNTLKNRKEEFKNKSYNKKKCR